MNGESLQDRVRSMLNVEVVAIFSRPRGPFDPGALLNDHRDFMVDLERKGLLLLSGPLTSGNGRITGCGLSILNVEAIEIAQTLWNDEPFYRAGLRDAEFYMWKLMEGALRMSSELSERSTMA